jgi:hypothetical protein
VKSEVVDVHPVSEALDLNLLGLHLDVEQHPSLLAVEAPHLDHLVHLGPAQLGPPDHLLKLLVEELGRTAPRPTSRGPIEALCRVIVWTSDRHFGHMGDALSDHLNHPVPDGRSPVRCPCPTTLRRLLNAAFSGGMNHPGSECSTGWKG